MPNVHFRLNDDEAKDLDRLVAAVSHWEVPRGANQKTTRSSALRDLLWAWAHGKLHMFPESQTLRSPNQREAPHES